MMNVAHVPLSDILTNKSRKIQRSNLNLPFANELIDPNFEWPELIAAAMDSVVTEQNPYPYEPRLILSTNVQLHDKLAEISQRTSSFYENIQHESKARIKEILLHKVSYESMMRIWFLLYTRSDK
jgi:hypothetical protein